MNSITRCLSVKQPASGAIVIGLKLIENRTWITPYRGVIAIHASSGFHTEWAKDLEEAGMLPPGSSKRECWTASAIIGTAEIVDCLKYNPGCEEHRQELIAAAISAGCIGKGKKDAERFIAWAEGDYCWLLRNPVKFSTPIHCHGKLNLWNLSPAQQSAVAMALADGSTATEVPEVNPVQPKPRRPKAPVASHESEPIGQVNPMRTPWPWEKQA
jgi:hypothetical protein